MLYVQPTHKKVADEATSSVAYMCADFDNKG